MFNLSGFKAQFTNPVRTNKYEVQIAVPPLLQQQSVGFINDVRRLTYMTPSVTFPTTELKPGLATRRLGPGLIERFPSNVEFKDLIIDFYADEDGKNLFFFTYWQEIALSHTSSSVTGTHEYKDNYATNIRVIGLTDQGAIHIEHLYERAYPIVVTGGKYQWSDVDNPLTFTVVFDFYRQTTTRGPLVT